MNAEFFQFLQRLDFFSLPVKLYQTKSLKVKNSKKGFTQMYTKLGSKIGFVFTTLIVAFTILYTSNEIKDIHNGLHDFYETNKLYHGYDGIYNTTTL